MRKTYCDRCDNELVGHRIFETVGDGDGKWVFEIPRQYRDSNGFARDICLTCLRDIVTRSEFE